MQNSQILNLGDVPRGEAEQDQVEMEDRYHTDTLIEQTRYDVQRMRLLVDQQHEEQQRHTKILSIVLAILLVVLAAAIWFSYPTFRDQKTAVAEMVGLKDVSLGLSGRLNAMEGKISSSFPVLSKQMNQLQADMKANMQSARTQAQAVANQVGQRIRDDVNHSLQAVQARIAGVESNQRESSAHVAQLENQIEKLNSELASLRQQSSVASEEVKALKESQQTSSRELSGLNERVVTNHNALTTMANRAEREKIDFTISDNKPAEIAPNIFFSVRRTNIKNQELDGTLQLGSKGTSLPIRGQGIRKPVLFYLPEENRPVELVISEIAKNKISGYIMMPSAIKTESDH